MSAFGDAKGAGVHVTTLCGNGKAGFTDGTGSNARFHHPSAVACDTSSKGFLVCDLSNHHIRFVSQKGEVIDYCGNVLHGVSGYTEGEGTACAFHSPRGLCINPKTNETVVADRDNHKIRIISPSRVARFYAGVGPPDEGGYKEKEAARFNSPSGVCLNWRYQVVVADTGNNRIRVINSSGVTTTFAGGGTKPDYADGKGRSARFRGPLGVCADKKGNLFVADTGNNCIRMINPQGMVGLLAGHRDAGDADGKGSSARFSSPSAVAIDDNGLLFVADTGNHKIKMLSVTTGVVTTLAGSVKGFKDGRGTEARFDSPRGIAVDTDGKLVVADFGNHSLRVVEPERAAEQTEEEKAREEMLAKYNADQRAACRACMPAADAPPAAAAAGSGTAASSGSGCILM